MIEFYRYISVYGQVIYFAVCKEQMTAVEYSQMFNNIYSPGVPDGWNSTFFGKKCESLVEELDREVNKDKAYKVSALELLIITGRSVNDIKKDFKRYKQFSPTP